jgi:hypothetical protein
LTFQNPQTGGSAGVCAQLHVPRKGGEKPWLKSFYCRKIEAYFNHMPVQKLPRDQHNSADNPEADAAPAEEYGEECGGPGGVPYCVFAYYPARIARVTVWHRQYVDGILLETDHGALPKIGGTGRHRDIRSDTFALEPGEFISGVSLEYWNYVDRITIHTNKGNYGPYGGSSGRLKKFLQAPPGRIVAGFKGRHWELVDSIRLMVVPEPKSHA